MTILHDAAELTGGSVPAHVSGAYPNLSCCGGPVQLVPDPAYAHITADQWREWHAHHDGSPCAYCGLDILMEHPAPAEERPLTRSQRSMQRLAQVIDDASIEGWRGDGGEA